MFEWKRIPCFRRLRVSRRSDSFEVQNVHRNTRLTGSCGVGVGIAVGGVAGYEVRGREGTRNQGSQPGRNESGHASERA